jgi:hypothetical protein
MRAEMMGTSRKEITAVVWPFRVWLTHREVKSPTVQGRTRARTRLSMRGTSRGWRDLDRIDNLEEMTTVLQVTKL